MTYEIHSCSIRNIVHGHWLQRKAAPCFQQGIGNMNLCYSAKIISILFPLFWVTRHFHRFTLNFSTLLLSILECAVVWQLKSPVDKTGNKGESKEICEIHCPQDIFLEQTDNYCWWTVKVCFKLSILQLKATNLCSLTDTIDTSPRNSKHQLAICTPTHYAEISALFAEFTDHKQRFSKQYLTHGEKKHTHTKTTSFWLNFTISWESILCLLSLFKVKVYKKQYFIAWEVTLRMNWLYNNVWIYCFKENSKE